MLLHGVIFAVTAAVFAADKKGILRRKTGITEEGVRLFLLAAVCGNLLGLFLTVSSLREPPGEGRIPRQEAWVCEEEWIAEAEDGTEQSVKLFIPEKEGTEPAGHESEAERELSLAEAVEEYNRERGDPAWFYLPETLKGRRLVWRKKRDTSGELLSAIFFLAAALLMVLKSREKEQEIRRKQEQMLLDYPGLIMKFTLLVQSGMSVRGTFERIAADYRRGSPGKKRWAYEEICVLCNELKSGASEAEAYRRLGERCGQIKYRTFATLLIQNLQRGNSRLTEMLERESQEAWEERKRKARAMGEAAAAKLLIPMLLMLLVVMAVILVPAFLSFYGST